MRPIRSSRLLWHLIVSRVPLLILVTALSACRGERGPAATHPLPEPVTAYPESPTTPPPGARQPAVTATDKPGPDNVIWEHLGQWKGTGSTQTESFTGQTGALRIKWQTKSAKDREGSFLLTIHSAISGRPLQVAVDQRGPGNDTAYINEDPRVFFAVVDAENIEWSFSVDEAIGTRTVPPK
jgi:hypothetical protein